MVGAHCSGKTTTLWHVGSFLKMHGLDNFTLIQESARHCPYPINEKAEFASENWMVLQQILAEADAQRKWSVVITDRSVFDPLIYYRYIIKKLFEAKNYDKFFAFNRELNYLHAVTKAWEEIAPYTHIFLFHPLELVVDVDRSPDKEYQTGVAELFEEFFAGWQNVSHVRERGREKCAETVANKIYELLKDV